MDALPKDSSSLEKYYNDAVDAVTNKADIQTGKDTLTVKWKPSPDSDKEYEITVEFSRSIESHEIVDARALFKEAAAKVISLAIMYKLGEPKGQGSDEGTSRIVLKSDAQGGEKLHRYVENPNQSISQELTDVKEYVKGDATKGESAHYEYRNVATYLTKKGEHRKVTNSPKLTEIDNKILELAKKAFALSFKPAVQSPATSPSAPASQPQSPSAAQKRADSNEDIIVTPSNQQLPPVKPQAPLESPQKSAELPQQQAQAPPPAQPQTQATAPAQPQPQPQAAAPASKPPEEAKQPDKADERPTVKLPTTFNELSKTNLTQLLKLKANLTPDPKAKEAVSVSTEFDKVLDDKLKMDIFKDSINLSNENGQKAALTKCLDIIDPNSNFDYSDKEKAVELLQHMVDSRHVRADVRQLAGVFLAKCYEQGVGTVNNDKEAEKLMEKLAAKPKQKLAVSSTTLKQEKVELPKTQSPAATEKKPAAESPKSQATAPKETNPDVKLPLTTNTSQTKEQNDIANSIKSMYKQTTPEAQKAANAMFDSSINLQIKFANEILSLISQQKDPEAQKKLKGYLDQIIDIYLPSINEGNRVDVLEDLIKVLKDSASLSPKDQAVKIEDFHKQSIDPWLRQNKPHIPTRQRIPLPDSDKSKPQTSASTTKTAESRKAEDPREIMARNMGEKTGIATVTFNNDGTIHSLLIGQLSVFFLKTDGYIWKQIEKSKAEINIDRPKEYNLALGRLSQFLNKVSEDDFSFKDLLKTKANLNDMLDAFKGFGIRDEICDVIQAKIDLDSGKIDQKRFDEIEKKATDLIKSYKDLVKTFSAKKPVVEQPKPQTAAKTEEQLKTAPKTEAKPKRSKPLSAEEVHLETPPNVKNKEK